MEQIQKVQTENEHTRNLQVNPGSLSKAFQPELIDRLFAKLSAMYGNRFLDMWREIEITDVKKCWADELRIYSVAQVGRAIDGLKTHNFPPTLPEFLQLCEAARKEIPRSSTTNQSQLPAKEEMENPECLEAKARFFATARQLNPSLADSIIGDNAK